MRRLILTALLIVMLLPIRSAAAQASGPIYIVEPGDTLSSIAAKFNVAIEDLKAVNNFENPDLLSPGMHVTIPGLPGISGILVTETVPLGETLRSLSIRRQLSPDQVISLNHLTSPAELFIGASLILPAPSEDPQPETRFLSAPGQSLFELAVSGGQNPYLLQELNTLPGTASLLPGEALFLPAGSTAGQAISLVSPLVSSLVIDPLPLVQGLATTVKVTALQPLELSGTLANYSLRFFTNGENQWVAMQGIYAMMDPGIYPITIQGKLEDGRSFSFEQMAVLKAGGYINENINGVDPATIDPANTKPENEQVDAIVAAATEKKYWDGPFSVPGYDPNWITSWYGTRRAYNGSGVYSAFHTGLDYGGGPGLEIKADAPGKVVFAGPMVVRGNATFIDHGWGVYSAFYHQSEFRVKVGDIVTAGQVIGIYGGTGRVTGPHLHWEIWVNGVQVDPQPWLERSFP